MCLVFQATTYSPISPPNIKYACRLEQERRIQKLMTIFSISLLSWPLFIMVFYLLVLWAYVSIYLGPRYATLR